MSSFLRMAGVLALAALASCRWPAAPRAHSYEIVFDESVGQLYSPFDTGFAGMSSLAAALRRAGATVSLSSQPLEGLLRTFRGPGHVLVLGPAMHRRYSAADLAAIAGFLRSGGGVLALVEHDDLFGNATMQNALLGRFGITAVASAAYGAGDDRRAAFWPRVRAARWELELELYYAAPLTVAPPARPLAELVAPENPALRVAAATAEPGSGRLAALGDCEVLWNMTPSTGSRLPANRRFLLRLFGWLAKGAGRFAGRAPAVASAVERVLVDVSAGGLDVDGSPSGLDAFAAQLRSRGFAVETGGGPATDYAAYSLVVIAAPLETLPAPDSIRRARRLLLAGDGQTDWLSDLPEIRREIAKHVPEVPGQPPYPLDAVSAPHGFRWRPRTIVARTTDLAAVARWDSDGATWHLQRAGVLAPVGHAFPGEIRVLARALPGTWAARNIVPLVEADGGAPSAAPPPDRPREAPPVVALSTPRVFAIAEAELLTNQHAGTAAAQRALAELWAWLRRP